MEQKQRIEHIQETEDFIRAHKQGAVMMAVINGKFSGIPLLIMSTLFKGLIYRGIRFPEWFSQGNHLFGNSISQF